MATQPKAVSDALVALGRTIAVARKTKGMTQQDLARRMGVTPVTISRIERGHPGTGVGHVFTALWLVDLPLWPSLDVPTTEQIRLLQAKADLMAPRVSRKRRNDDF